MPLISFLEGEGSSSLAVVSEEKPDGNPKTEQEMETDTRVAKRYFMFRRYVAIIFSLATCGLILWTTIILFMVFFFGFCLYIWMFLIVLMVMNIPFLVLIYVNRALLEDEEKPYFDIAKEYCGKNWHEISMYKRWELLLKGSWTYYRSWQIANLWTIWCAWAAWCCAHVCAFWSYVPVWSYAGAVTLTFDENAWLNCFYEGTNQAQAFYGFQPTH